MWNPEGVLLSKNHLITSTKCPNIWPKIVAVNPPSALQSDFTVKPESTLEMTWSFYDDEPTTIIHSTLFS